MTDTEILDFFWEKNRLTDTQVVDAILNYDCDDDDVRSAQNLIREERAKQ